MTDLVFVDTNVLAYAWDPLEPSKQHIAREWLNELCDARRARTSVQVLSELFVFLTQKLDTVLQPKDAWVVVEELLPWNPQVLDSDVLDQAWEIKEGYRLSWWDCLVVAAAQFQRCSTLLTEDLQHGGLYGGVEVLNPFKLGVSEPKVPYMTPIVRRRRPTRSEA